MRINHIAPGVDSEGGVRLWATEGRDTEPVKFMPRPQRARPFRICFSGDDSARYLVCAFTDGWLAAWNLDAVDQEPNWRQAHSGPIWTLIDLDDDDRREPLVASGGSDRSLCVWGIADDGAIVARQKFEADGTIRRLGHAVDGEREGKVPMLASASATGAVSLWRYDGPADRPLMEAARHRGEVIAQDGWPTEGPLPAMDERAVDRQAIQRALGEHGYLLFKRRRLPLPIEKQKTAIIM